MSSLHHYAYKVTISCQKGREHEFSTYKHTKSPSAVRDERELVVDMEASFSPHQQKY